jgi:hypothetical protein
MKMEPIESSETSAFKTKKPGNYPKENILNIEHGESLKPRIKLFENSIHVSFLIKCRKVLGYTNRSVSAKPRGAKPVS